MRYEINVVFADDFSVRYVVENDSDSFINCMLKFHNLLKSRYFGEKVVSFNATLLPELSEK